MESVKRFREIIYGGLSGIISRYCDCIGRHNKRVYVQLYNVLSNVKSEVEARLRKIETSKVRDVSIDNVLPIDVDIDCKEFRERRSIKIDVYDYRLGRRYLQSTSLQLLQPLQHSTSSYVSSQCLQINSLRFLLLRSLKRLCHHHSKCCS
jgi:hypothetical protein